MKLQRILNILMVIMVIMLMAISTVCGSSGGSGEGQESEYKEMTVILSHSAPVTDPRHLGALKFKEVIEGESGGKITVDVYPSGQLGGEEAIQACQGGAIQVQINPPASLVGYQPLLGLLDVPYFVPSEIEKAREIMSGPAGNAMLKLLEEANFKGLAFWDSQYKHFTTNKPLRSTADFKGLKFRVMASDMLFEMIRAFGGDAINFNYSEVYTGLQTGAIDGQESSLVSIYNMKFHEVQDYLTKTYHIKSEFVFYCNKPWFDSLDDKTKALVLKAAEEGGKVNNALKAEMESKSEMLIEEEGTTIIELTPEELEAFKDVTRQRCLDYFVEKNGQRAQELVDLFNTEIMKAQ